MKTFLLFFALLLSIGSFAIDNDNCANATFLTVSSTCTPISYNTLDATTSGDAVPTCGFYQGGDAWFIFTAPASGNFRIELTDEGIGNPRFQLYTGSCAELVPFECQGETTNYSDPALAGETFYVQVFSFNGSGGAEFSLCVMETTPPVNNLCEDFITLNVGTECTTQSFNNLYATGDNGSGPNPTCGFYSGGDVWFQFEVPADGQFRLELTDEGAGNPQGFLYTGSCGSLVQFGCLFSEDFININDPSLGGEIMTLRMFGFNSEYLIEFGLCVFEVDYAVNDNCADALALSVGTECTPATYSTMYATDEPGIAPGPGCGFYQGGDVWFTAVVPASGHLRIENDDVDGNSHFTVYTGTCGEMAVYDCQNSAGDLNINDAALAGETIYLRYWRYNSQRVCSFSVCLWEPNTIPNDDCADATPLPVSTECTFTSYTNEGATKEEGVAPNPNCGFYQNADVWFTIDMPLSGHLRIDLINTGAIGVGYQLYEGTCGAMTRVDCRALFDHLNVHEDALAGQTLYLRVYPYNSAGLINFDICVTEPDIPDYDFCETAQEVELTGGCQMVEYSNEFTTSESETPQPGCGFYQGNDVWFAITVPASGLLIVETGEVDFNKPCLAMYSGDCSDPTLLECSESGSEVNSGKIILDNIALAGETLYFRVFRYNSRAGGAFTLCAYDPNICGVYQFEEGIQTVCDPENGEYDQELIVSYINAPETGFLNVNGIDYPITGSPQTIVIPDLFANYEFVNVTAFFTDDPSCTYSENFVYREPLTCFCPGDINNDETVTAADLLLLLGAYGCSSGCPIDLNEDGTTDTADLLLLLGQIGQDCPGL